MVDNLFFSRCCNSSTTSLRYSSSLDQAFCDLAFAVSADRPIVLDAPDREAAHGQKDDQKRKCARNRLKHR